MILDISQPLREGIPVWPGDTEFAFDLAWKKEQTGSVNVGRLTMSTHTGTHVDAPFHFRDDGARVAALDLEAFLGPARVIEIHGEESIGAEELERYVLEGVERLLVKTGSWPDRETFPASITHLRPDAAPFLAEKGVRLVGVDAPSVDPLDSKDLPAHEALRANGIHILEGLVLDRIEPGDYELIALPLALEEADASPVRAVLRSLP
ncbi:MAG: arylformamidase [Rubrobacteraceae bacterium]